MKEKLPYQAYLMRLWHTKRGGKADYRVFLQDVSDGEEKSFANLKDLYAYLRARAEVGGNAKESGEQRARM